MKSKSFSEGAHANLADSPFILHLKTLRYALRYLLTRACRSHMPAWSTRAPATHQKAGQERSGWQRECERERESEAEQSLRAQYRVVEWFL